LELNKENNMATQLVKYEQGSGAGVAVGKNVGKLVIGNTFPSTTADGMVGVACDWSGNTYISDITTNAVYKVTEGGKVSLFAGLPNNDGLVNGTGTAARFQNPRGIACDKSGNVYVADTGNNRIRKIDPNGRVTTIAGGFNSPYDVAVAPNGDVIVADFGNHRIYRVEAGGRKTLVAGSTAGNVAGYSGTTKIKGSAAKFNYPTSVTVDNTGNIYVADNQNCQIKIIHPDGWVKVFSGSGVPGNLNGIASAARFTSLICIKANRSGFLYATDRVATYNRIKKIDPNGNVSTFANPVKNEICSGLAVSPADKVFVVTVDSGVAPGYESSSSSSSESSDNSASSRSSASSVSSSRTESSESSASESSVSSVSSSRTESSESSASSSRTESSVSSGSSKSSSSESSASSKNSQSSGSSASSESPGVR
jgi:streptogramin lyase